MIELRDYQNELYKKARASFNDGHKRVLVTVGCGAGKSYIAAKMAENCKGDVLLLTHRHELLDQTGSLFKENGIKARTAMILTEANHLGEHGKPTMIIADEAHLSRSNSWMKVLDFYDTFVVGFTATPVRLDQKPLGDVFDDLVTGVSTKWLIGHHRLAPYEYYAPTAVETDDLRKVAGDFVIKDLEDLMMNKAIYGNVFDSWQRLAGGAKTIAYCVSVTHAKATAEMFMNHGIKAIELDSGTLPKKRKEIMDAFREGKYQVLCNVGIISEGVSIDDVECCLLLRPTDSLALYHQQAMRCMRYLPGKTAKIIDCVANYTRNQLPDADIEWSLTESVKKPRRYTDEGDFTLRSCTNCFRTFKAAPVCPFCGTPAELHPREIKKHEEIKLQKITEEQAAEAERQRKKLRMEQGRAKSFEELVAIGRARGMRNPTAWAYFVMKGRKHR